MSNTLLVIKLRSLGFELLYNDSLELTHISVPNSAEGFAMATIRWDEIIQISYDEWNTI
jgi:hypothetical protein